MSQFRYCRYLHFEVLSFVVLRNCNISTPIDENLPAQLCDIEVLSQKVIVQLYPTISTPVDESLPAQRPCQLAHTLTTRRSWQWSAIFFIRHFYRPFFIGHFYSDYILLAFFISHLIIGNFFIGHFLGNQHIWHLFWEVSERGMPKVVKGCWLAALANFVDSLKGLKSPIWASARLLKATFDDIGRRLLMGFSFHSDAFHQRWHSRSPGPKRNLNVSPDNNFSSTLPTVSRVENKTRQKSSWWW